jgi:hypothetical protein
MYIFISEGFPQTAFNGVTVNNTEKGGFLKFQRARERERESEREPASGALARNEDE